MESEARTALLQTDPGAKVEAVRALVARWRAGQLGRATRSSPLPPVDEPGRPARPLLVSPERVPKRPVSRHSDGAALLHAVTHIEFNAINLALDCVARFPAQPNAFVDDWLQIAAEEAEHFTLLTARLEATGHRYGDFPAHDGLWKMALATADDLLARMALVPRLLEARGLDATPPIRQKFELLGDRSTVAALDVILHDEVGHVAIGDRWFRAACTVQGLEPERTFRSLLRRFEAPWPKPPFNVEARLRAGFSQQELSVLALGRGATES